MERNAIAVSAVATERQLTLDDVGNFRCSGELGFAKRLLRRARGGVGGRVLDLRRSRRLLR